MSTAQELAAYNRERIPVILQAVLQQPYLETTMLAMRNIHEAAEKMPTQKHRPVGPYDAATDGQILTLVLIAEKTSNITLLYPLRRNNVHSGQIAVHWNPN